MLLHTALALYVHVWLESSREEGGEGSEHGPLVSAVSEAVWLIRDPRSP